MPSTRSSSSNTSGSSSSSSSSSSNTSSGSSSNLVVVTHFVDITTLMLTVVFHSTPCPITPSIKRLNQP